jgi:hypothetical protein
VIHLGAQPEREVGVPVDAQRLGGVLDPPWPGRDGQIGQDGDLLVRQVVDDRQASSPLVAGGRQLGSSAIRPSPSPGTQAPTATRPTARRHSRLFPAAGPRGDPLGDLSVRCRVRTVSRAECHPLGVERRAESEASPRLARLRDRDGCSPRDAARKAFRAAGVRC